VAGPFALSLQLLDSLSAGKVAGQRGRIINVVSDTYVWGDINLATLSNSKDPSAQARHHRWWAYCDTKAAEISLTFELQRRLKTRGMDSVQVLAVHPGVRWGLFGLGFCPVQHGTNSIHCSPS